MVELLFYLKKLEVKMQDFKTYLLKFIMNLNITKVFQKIRFITKQHQSEVY